MPDRVAPGTTAVVLLASAHEWASRSLETLLGPAGYAVIRAHTGAGALEAARRSRPDAIVMDAALPQLDGLAVCRALRAHSWVSASTPIFVLLPEPLTRQRTLEVLRAGANAVWGHPLDAEEFLLRLEGYLRAKFDADRARVDSLVDPMTGLYNARGLARRARELESQAGRFGSPVACVVFALDAEPADASGSPAPGTPDGASAPPAPPVPSTPPDPTTDPDLVLLALAHALLGSARLSDAVGRLGTSELALLAPHTDGKGAAQLGVRLSKVMERAGNAARAGGGAVRVRASYATAVAPLDSEGLLARARQAGRPEGVSGKP